MGGEEIRTPTHPTLVPTCYGHQPSARQPSEARQRHRPRQEGTHGHTYQYSNPTRSSREHPRPSAPGSPILLATAVRDNVQLATCHGPITEHRNRAGVVTHPQSRPCVEKLGVLVLFVVVLVTSATLSIWASDTIICRFTPIKEVRGQVYREHRGQCNDAIHHNHYFNILYSETT